MSGFFAAYNRGKKSVAIDLKTEKGREIFLRLVEQVDVLTENFLPGSMNKIGLGYDTLKKYNPRLIYGVCSGFGQTGPDANKPGFDIISQAMSGLISLTGPEEGPLVKSGVDIGDIISSIFLAFGILAALEERHKSNLGQYVDISILDSVVAIMEGPFMRYFATGQVPGPIGHRHYAAAIHQFFPTKDGYIAIVASGPFEMWVRFLEVLGIPELLDDERFHARLGRREHLSEIEPKLNEAFRKKTTAEWIKLYEAEGIACGPVNNVAQATSNPQLQARNMFIETPYHGKFGNLKQTNSPMNFSRTPHKPVPLVPKFGEHTEEILSKMLHMSKDEIIALSQQGVITCGKCKS